MVLNYLLDTNICIYIAKNKPPTVLDKFTKLKIGQVGMSLITYGELLYGIQKSNHKAQALLILKQLISLIPPFHIPEKAAENYALIRHQLANQGTIIGNNDLWIAAHCLALDVTLVTNNIKEFNRVPNLNIVNWV